MKKKQISRLWQKKATCRLLRVKVSQTMRPKQIKKSLVKKEFREKVFLIFDHEFIH